MGGTTTAPTNKQTEAWGSGVKIDYVEATDTYTVTASTGGSASFTPLERSIFFSYPVAQWAKTNPDNSTDTLTLVVPSDPGPLHYTASGSWIHADDATATSQRQTHFFVTGIPTLSTDMPVSGSASYLFKASGTIVQNGALYNVYSPQTTGTFTADFASGAIATSLHLIGRLTAPGSPSVDFGTYTGTGTVSTGGPGFTGTLTGASSRTGVFSGAFFGPQGIEIGYGWALQGTNFDAQGNGVGLSVTAAAQAYPTIDDIDGDFHLQSAGITFKGTPTAPTNQTSMSFGSGFKVDFDADAGILSLNSSTGGVTFDSTNQVNDPSLPANVVQWRKIAGGVTDTLTRVIPTLNGVALSYTMIGTWAHVDAGASANTIFHNSVTGVPTGMDMPTTGTATYTLATGGIAQESGVSYNIVGTTPNVTLSADFATGAISTTLTLAGQPTAGGNSVALGTYTGIGAIASGTPGFEGTLTGASSRTGLFSGAFFGPGAAETGFGWALQGTAFTAQGIAAGKKD